MSASNMLFPGQTHPGDPTGLSVPAIEAKTAPMPTTRSSETAYYYCPVPNTSMFRPDGMRLVFIQGVHATDLVSTQKYLNDEIAEAHPYLSVATEEQVQRYKMHVNPRGTIEEELRPKLEIELRAKLEAQIREEMMQKGVAPLSSEEKLGGVDSSVAAAKTRSGTGMVSSPQPLPAFASPPSPSASFQASAVGSDKLAGAAAGSASSPSVAGKVG